MLSLKTAKIGKFYKTKEISEFAYTKTARRLFDLGFTCGQSVKVVRKSLLGQTLLVEIRGYILSLRSSVAELVILQEN